MEFFHNLLWMLILIGVMIVIHELGHFWAARLFDVRVDAFSIGFGPRLFGFRRGETDYRVSAFPFGGYVKMHGEQFGEEEQASDPRSFLAKPKWQRLIIAFAGPLMNILLAIGLLTGLFMFQFQKVAEPPERGLIGHVLQGSPADKAGVEENDRIVAIDGLERPSWEDILMKEIGSANKALSVTVERNGSNKDFLVTPTLDERTGVGFAGWSARNEIEVSAITPGLPADKAGIKKGDLLVSINGEPVHSTFKLREVIKDNGGKPVKLVYSRAGREQEVELKPVYETSDGQQYWMIGVLPGPKLELITTQLSFSEAFRESIRQNQRGATLIFGFLRGLVERRMSAKQLQGPIGIAQLSGAAAREGASSYIFLMSMVSLNLAIFNLLPIPILDGGVILLLLVEMILRRDLSLAVKETVIKVGFVFLMAVTVFVLYNDITKILPKG